MADKPRKPKQRKGDVADLTSRLKTAALNQSTSIPDGKLEEVVTYLQMTSAPTQPRAIRRFTNLAIIRAHNPTVSFYRFLYNTVGAPWLWHERRVMTDQDLTEIIKDKLVYIYVLYVGGVPAGYVELDARIDDEIEITFFGLAPEFIGRGLGQYFLSWAIDKAWNFEPNRVWVHTCNHDHPHAIAVYQRAGFVPYRQERNIIDDPRLLGIMQES